MPRYEYKCKKCDKSFEVVHGINENHEKCKYCGGPVRRVFHPVGIVFKGSGFYATDSRGKDKHLQAAEEEAKPKAEKPSATKEAKSKDKKPEESVKAST